MCRLLHPEEEEVVAAGVEAQQLDLEAAEAEVAEAEVAEAEVEAAEPTQGCERLSEARAEIADARAELAEARVAIAAPPADAVIHDIADDDPPPPVPSRFECAGDQRVLLASFETLARDALRR